MARKINMLALSVVLTIIVFIAVTALQRMLVHYEPTVKVVTAVQEIQVNRVLNTYMFKAVDVPISMVSTLKVVKNINDVKNHYSIEPIHKGEILRFEAISAKGDVKIIDVGPGREKVSVKLKGPENAISYQVKTGDAVKLYFTGRTDTVKALAVQRESFSSDIPGEEDGYCTITLLDKAVVLGVFDSSGASLGDYARREKVDTVVFSVTHEDAIAINNCKGQGTFDITGLPYGEGLE